MEWIDDLVDPPSEEEVHHAAECHLRTGHRTLPYFLSCKYCDADDTIQQLQDLLYMKMTYNTG